MFKTPHPNVIESDEGFSVQVFMTYILYTEDTKQIRIGSEILASPGNIAIFKDTIHSWEPPHEKILVDDPKRLEILDNITRAFRSKGEWITIL
jgi:hypothetical protein